MTKQQSNESDLLIVGGGPAGLSTAITGASEGLSVTVIDSGSTFGGQARESSAIENYPGFPAGVTGEDLMSSLVAQAYKFRTGMWCPIGGVKLQKDKTRIILSCDDYTEFVAKACVIAIGLTYKRLPTHNLPIYLGYGAYYGVPNNMVHSDEECNYIVVGGANSAGQAAVHLSKNEKANVHMVIRGRIEEKMSAYLLERIKKTKNIEVIEHATAHSVGGDNNRLQWCTITVEDGNGSSVNRTIKCRCLFIFIGASPRTYWLDGFLALDEHKFILTWSDLKNSDGEVPELMRSRLPYETSVPGVFACGDVRYNSTKRVASAVGEGASTLQMVHRYISMMEK